MIEQICEDVCTYIRFSKLQYQNITKLMTKLIKFFVIADM